MRIAVVIAMVLGSAVLAAPALASEPAPVASLTPRATQQLWRQLVRKEHAQRAPAAIADCRPLRAVFYAESDWLRLATKLAANASPCAQYYISIPPLAADKTAFRSNQAWRIRALGPNFHVLAEVNYTGWSKWVASTGATFYDAGVEARRRLAAAGFDVTAGDTWAVNEFSSAVRGGTGVARQKVRDLVRGLYTGDGTQPAARGVVFDIGLDQSTPDLSTYKALLQSWYADSAFWQDMSSYVSDWSQELYGDVRDEAVAGAPVATRLAYLDDYLGHQLTLANAGPAEVAGARSFLQQAYTPLANAAWMWSSAYGFTNVPVDQMQDFTTAQVAALRSFDATNGFTSDRFGFAWAPRMSDGSSWTTQFTSDSGALLDRLAAALHDSDQSPAAACGSAWCFAGLAGAAFTDTWKTFAAWTPHALAFTTPPQTVATGAATAPITLQLLTGTVAVPPGAPVPVTLASSSPGGTFGLAAAGPWTSTLTTAVQPGATTATFYYSDTVPGTATITATTADGATATQAVAVTTTTTPAPPASGGGSGAVPPDLHVDLAANATGAPPPGTQLVYTITVSTANAGSASAVRLDVTLPAGVVLAGTSSDRGAGCAGAAPQLTCDVAWISPGTSTHVTIVTTVQSSSTLTATATATSLVEPEANPADNTVTLSLVPASPVAPTSVLPHVLARPRVVGSPMVGRRVHVAVPRWSVSPTRVGYVWQLCWGTRCTRRGEGMLSLRLRRGDAGKRMRFVATAFFGDTRVVTSSIPVRVHPGS